MADTVWDHGKNTQRSREIAGAWQDGEAGLIAEIRSFLHNLEDHGVEFGVTQKSFTASADRIADVALRAILKEFGYALPDDLDVYVDLPRNEVGS